MLAEWLTWLAADCSSTARKLGYLRESIGIRSRYWRCKRAWQPHLDHSRSALLSSLDECRSHRTALVLGSGLLLDIPLGELAARFDWVWLVDIVHLPEVRRSVRAYRNVRLIEMDIAGLGEPPYDPERVPDPDAFLSEMEIDWVASVNLLSQLPLMPQQWMRRSGIDEERVQEWGQLLMRRHLDYLARFNAPVCLLADAEQVTYDGRGGIEKTDFAIASHFRMQTLWRWDVAPLGEISPGTGRFHSVGCYSRSGSI